MFQATWQPSTPHDLSFSLAIHTNRFCRNVVRKAEKSAVLDATALPTVVPKPGRVNGVLLLLSLVSALFHFAF